ncbi:MAG: ABC transporter ATP-binding protein [Frankia sp.]
MTSPARETAVETRGSGSSLELSSVVAGYGRITVLRKVDLSVPAGSVVALVGANGAGKTTLMRVASGLLRPTSGTVRIAGREVTDVSAHKRARSGLCLIPEGRGIFRGLTVRENLRLAVPPWLDGSGIDRAVAAFPILGKRLGQTAGTLSGGEQQMLAMARAYLSEAKVILCDELSIGLAPIVLDQIFDSLRQLAAEEISLLIVEQYVHQVLALADTAYVLVRGEVAWHGPSADIDGKLLVESYLS